MKSPACAILRIAKHLNYKRTFLARDCTRVDIPCIPYEAFEFSGIKINPWYIQNIINAVRSVSFTDNIERNEYPRSTLDFHGLLGNHLIFIVGVTMDIHHSLHDFDVPKSPLYVIEKLKYLGTTSKTLSYDIHQGDNDVLFATCDVTDVLVSGENCKPVAYPDWWLQKHGDLATVEKAKLEEEQTPSSKPVISEINVKSSDINTYLHTNWVSYLKFCYESFTDHAMTNSYNRLNKTHLNNGVKSCSLIYKDESSLGDLLQIQSWASDSKEDNVIFNVLKDNKLCLYAKVNFYR